MLRFNGHRIINAPPRLPRFREQPRTNHLSSSAVHPGGFVRMLLGESQTAYPFSSRSEASCCVILRLGGSTAGFASCV